MSSCRLPSLTLSPDLQFTSWPLFEQALLYGCITLTWAVPALTLHRDRGQLDSAVQALVTIVLWARNVVLAPACDLLKELHGFASHYIACLQTGCTLQLCNLACIQFLLSRLLLLLAGVHTRSDRQPTSASRHSVGLQATAVAPRGTSA